MPTLNKAERKEVAKSIQTFRDAVFDAYRTPEGKKSSSRNSPEKAAAKKRVDAFIATIDFDKDSPQEIATKCKQLTEMVTNFNWHSPGGKTGKAITSFYASLDRTPAKMERYVQPKSAPADPSTIPTWMGGTAAPKQAATTPAQKPSAPPPPAYQPGTPAYQKMADELKSAAQALCDALPGLKLEVKENATLRDIQKACTTLMDVAREHEDYSPGKNHPTSKALVHLSNTLKESQRPHSTERSGATPAGSQATSKESKPAQNVMDEMRKKLSSENLGLKNIPKNN